MTKIDQALAVLEKNPRLKSKEVEQLAGCSDRTVTRARALMSMSSPTIPPESPSEPPKIGEDPVDMLTRVCLAQLAKANPNPSWANVLKDILKATNKLDIKNQEESRFHNQLQKQDMNSLVRLATGKVSKSGENSQDEEQTDSLYQ